MVWNPIHEEPSRPVDVAPVAPAPRCTTKMLHGLQRFIREYPNLCNYTRDMYQTPGVAASVNITHIKTHYFTSHPRLNYYAIIPLGNDSEAWWEQAHDRAERFAK